MITLLCKDPSIHTYFESRPQVSFQWVIYVDDVPFRSDWQSLSEAKELDRYLLTEFMSQFRAWNKIEGTAKLAYLDAAKKALDSGQRWFERTFPSIHRTYEVYNSARYQLQADLLKQHPSGQFCTVKPKESDVDGYFAFCRSKLWSSREWLAPKKWLDAADAMFPPEHVNGASGGAVGRTISVSVRNEVWRRDEGRCVVCGSRERLEYDHIIPVAMGGSSTARNVQLLCEACNRQKGATLG